MQSSGESKGVEKKPLSPSPSTAQAELTPERVASLSRSLLRQDRGARPEFSPRYVATQQVLLAAASTKRAGKDEKTRDAGSTTSLMSGRTEEAERRKESSPGLRSSTGAPSQSVSSLSDKAKGESTPTSRSQPQSTTPISSTSALSSGGRDEYSGGSGTSRGHSPSSLSHLLSQTTLSATSQGERSISSSGHRVSVSEERVATESSSSGSAKVMLERKTMQMLIPKRTDAPYMRSFQAVLHTAVDSDLYPTTDDADLQSMDSFNAVPVVRCMMSSVDSSDTIFPELPHILLRTVKPLPVGGHIVLLQSAETLQAKMLHCSCYRHLCLYELYCSCDDIHCEWPEEMHRKGAFPDFKHVVLESDLQQPGTGGDSTQGQ